MLQIRGNALRLAQQKSLRQSHRRHDTTKATTGHSASAGHAGPSHSSHHPEPVNESLGRGFYISLALLPLGFALYKFSNNSTSPTTQPLLTRLIQSWSEYRDSWTARNTLHTRMAEQAAHDRHLFAGTQRTRMVDLRFPEVFNSGSPFNVQAGQTANLDALIAHYQEKNREDEAEFQRKRDARRGT